MKRLFGLCVLFGIALGVKGQVEKVGDIQFEEVPVMHIGNAWDRMNYFIDGKYHIVSFVTNWSSQCAIYNISTGESTPCEFIIREAFDFGDFVVYQGSRKVGNFTQVRYLRLSDDGVFQILPDLPGHPTAFHNGKGFVASNQGLYEVSFNPFLQSRRIGDASANAMMQVQGDSLYIGYDNTLQIYDIPNDTLFNAYEAYFAGKSLELIPWSGMDGRFLYIDQSDDTFFELHEIGGKNTARPVTGIGELPPYLFSNIDWHISLFPELCISISGDKTYMLSYTEGPIDYFSNVRLIEIDRNQSAPYVQELSRFKRGLSESKSGFAIQGLNAGNKLAAVGLFGPEGCEPYGLIDGEIEALNDLYPGPLGSADYLLDSGRLPGMKRRFHTHFDKLWFMAASPGVGHELAVSDGTKEGTYVVADLEPGTLGIRELSFASDGDGLFTAVQHQDFSVSIYSIGENVNAIEAPSPDPIHWETSLGIFPDSWVMPNFSNPFSEPRIASDAEGNIFQLSSGGPLGHWIGDSVGVYTYPPAGEAGSIFNTHTTQRLRKIDGMTGELLWSLPFMARSDLTEPSEAVVVCTDDGTTAVIGFRRNAYISYNGDTNLLPSISWAMSITRFSSSGEFVDIQWLDAENQYGQIYFARGGEYIELIARHLSSDKGIDYLKFTAEGQLISRKSLGLPRNSSLKIREHNGKFFASSYNDANVCNDCKAEFWILDENLSTIHYSFFSYNGKIVDPELNIMANGEHWYSGAVNGEIFLPSTGEAFMAPSESPKTLNIFLIRLLKSPTDKVLSSEVLREGAITYFPSMVVENNLFLSYTALDPAVERSPFENLGYFQLDIPLVAEAVHETAQLDGAGRVQMVHSDKVFLCMPGQATEYSHSLMGNGSWLRAFAANKAHCAHIDWHLPKPGFQRDYKGHIQIAKAEWPFSPVDIPIIPATPDADESYMHIFPNPTSSGSFYIIPRKGNQIPYNRFHIHDMQGRLIYESPLNDFFNALEVQLPQHLNAGVYNVVFTGEVARESHRLVLVK